MIQLVEGTMHPAYSLTCLEEERDFRERYWKVQPGDEVIDVGASYGAYTLTALDAGAAMVWAFEPEPSIAVDLQRNIEANDWGDRARVFQEALWDKSDRVDMKQYAPHWPAQTITGFYHARALDDVAALTQRLDWLKVDVEGAEAKVLVGAAQTIRRCKPTVIVEVHTFIDRRLLDTCRGWLQNCGYQHFEEVPRDPCVMLIGRPR